MLLGQKKDGQKMERKDEESEYQQLRNLLMIVYTFYFNVYDYFGLGRVMENSKRKFVFKFSMMKNDSRSKIAAK